MGALAFPQLPDRRESLRGTVLASLGFHIALFAALLFYSSFGSLGPRWGESGEGGAAVHVNTVKDLPGIPLPSPMISTRNTVQTENPGLYQSEPEPKLEPAPESIEIPKFKDSVKPVKPERINKRIQPKEPPSVPDNAVPFGEQGLPAEEYNESSVPGAKGSGIGINMGDFGQRYAWYVTALRNRISTNWLLTMVSPNLMSAPRVYLAFDILRDGTITGVQITQSSGIPEVDRSAIRAVVASSPVNPLPADYAGSRLTVKFYFDFRR